MSDSNPFDMILDRSIVVTLILQIEVSRTFFKLSHRILLLKASKIHFQSVPYGPKSVCQLTQLSIKIDRSGEVRHRNIFENTAINLTFLRVTDTIYKK